MIGLLIAQYYEKLFLFFCDQKNLIIVILIQIPVIYDIYCDDFRIDMINYLKRDKKFKEYWDTEKMDFRERKI